MAETTFDVIVSEGGISDTRPSMGELTPGQGRVASTGMFSMLGGFNKPPPGTFRTYRRMRGNPTIAMARIAAFAPVKSAPWSIEADDDVPDEVKEFIEEQVMPLRMGFLRDAAFALDYGFAGWEKVFQVATVNGQQRIVIDKLKPLLVDSTAIQVNKITGAFAGFKQKDIMLGPEKCLLFTHDKEAGDLYGRSRNENCRKVWAAWEETLDKIGAQVRKASGTTPVLEYPEGRSRDADGSKVDNYDIAVGILRNLSVGMGVVMPNTIARWAHELVQRGIDPTKIKAWTLQFLETATGHVAEWTGTLEHLEKQIARGWLVPERAIIEATTAGSRADAENATDLALEVCEQLAQELDFTISNYVINQLVLLNYGDQYIDAIRLKHRPLTEASRAMMKAIMTAVLSAPANLQLLLDLIDVDSELDKLDVATTGSVADIRDTIQTPSEQAAIKGVADQLRAMKPSGGENGMMDKTMQPAKAAASTN